MAYDLSSIRLNMAKQVNDALDAILNKNYKKYVLLLTQGVRIPRLGEYAKTDYAIDYQIDRNEDETRERFYLEYLNKNYTKNGYIYAGTNGFVDLNLELMIYSHIWESYYLLKILVQIADILDNRDYDWEFEIDEDNRKDFINDRIIIPLKKYGLELGHTIERLYDSSLRNAFAHSLYSIDEKCKKIYLLPKLKSFKNAKKIVYSFEEFQILFLESINLSYFISNFVSTRRHKLAEINGYIIEPEDPILLPDKKEIAIKGSFRDVDGRSYPEFQGILINHIPINPDSIFTYKKGNWVIYKRTGTIHQIDDVRIGSNNMEIGIKLKGADLYCIDSLVFPITDFSSIINANKYNAPVTIALFEIFGDNYVNSIHSLQNYIEKENIEELKELIFPYTSEEVPIDLLK